MNQRKSDVSKEVIDRLINLTLVAVGNILVMAGENLIEKGKDRLDSDSKNDTNERNG